MWDKRPAHLGLPVRDERLCRTIPHQMTQGKRISGDAGRSDMCEGVLRVSGKESFTNPTRGKKPNGTRRIPAQLTPISFEVRSCILVRVVAITFAGTVPLSRTAW
jgi:hypothetical protein